MRDVSTTGGTNNEGCIYYWWVCPFFYFKIWRHGIQ